MWVFVMKDASLYLVKVDFTVAIKVYGLHHLSQRCSTHTEPEFLHYTIELFTVDCTTAKR